MSILQAKENQHLKASQMEVGKLKPKLEGYKALENENKRLNSRIIESEQEFKKLREEVEKEQDYKQELLRVSSYICAI